MSTPTKPTLIIFDYQGTLFKYGALVRGMDAVITETAKNSLLTIVSFSGREGIISSLKKEQLFSYFSDIKTCYGSDTKGQAIKNFADEKNIPLTRCLFITDTHNDIYEAKKSGIPAIFVAWGNETSLPEDRETMIVRTPGELSSLLIHFFASS